MSLFGNNLLAESQPLRTLLLEIPDDKEMRVWQVTCTERHVMTPTRKKTLTRKGGAVLGCLEQRRTLDVYLVPCQDCMPDIPGSRAVNMTLLLMSLADETLDNSSPFFQGHTA